MKIPHIFSSKANQITRALSSIFFFTSIIFPVLVLAQNSSSPVITAISAKAASPSAGNVSVTTNEATNAEVDYGLSTGYGQENLDTNSATTHSFTLSGLLPNTTYFYRVEVVDASGNTSYSNANSFTTPPAPGSGGTTSGSASTGNTNTSVNTSGTQATGGATGASDPGSAGFQIVPCNAPPAMISSTGQPVVGTNVDPTTVTSTYGGDAVTPCDFNALLTLVQRIINFLLYAAIFIATLSIVHAGFIYLNAGGDSGKTKKAKDIFRVTFIGLAIALCSWIVVYTVVTAVVNPNLPYMMFLQKQ
ncbi:MAG TPA: fibronectin type III domain-containing protein [Candidatus Paceibacterota bacterium]|nr:fibronectin type III domain-containing protein [Candidatus Paceibacterota bacterium]